MGSKSDIQWTNASWTPIRARNLATGKVGWHCVHASEGCRFCYAEGFNARLGTGERYTPGALKERDGLIEVFLDEEMLLAPLRWKKPRMIFVCSMTDLFAEFVTDDQIDRVVATMARATDHTFQVLTKRADRMQRYFSALRPAVTFPLPNVWLGVSAERQQEADERIPLLLQTPAAVRFVSAEPLLGPIDLRTIKWPSDGLGTWLDVIDPRWPERFPLDRGLDWVIVGGESGPHARPMHPDWVRKIRDDCAAAGVSFFFKQWGEWIPFYDRDVDDPDWRAVPRVDNQMGRGAERFHNLAGGVGFHGERVVAMRRVGKKAAGRLLDGVEHNEFPIRARSAGSLPLTIAGNEPGGRAGAVSSSK